MKQPSGRSSGRVEHASAKPQHTRRLETNKDNDSTGSPLSVMTRPRRLTIRQLEQVRQQLSPRDLAIVQIVAEHKWVRASHVQRLYVRDGTAASSARRARGILQRLVTLRVLLRLDRRIGGVRAGSASHIYGLDVAGQFVVQHWNRQTGKRRTWTPSETFLRHTLALSELYVRTTEAHRRSQFELIEWQAEPTCWRQFFGATGRITLKPDAFLRIGHGDYEDLWFVEVDCGSESSRALLGKFRLYRQYWSSNKEQQRWGVFPKVLWLAPSLRRLGQLLDIAREQPPESWQLFGVCLFDEATQHFRKDPVS